MVAKNFRDFFCKAMTPDKLIEYCEDSGIAIENLEASKSSLPDQPTGKSKLIYGLQAVMNEFRDNFFLPVPGTAYKQILIATTLEEFDSNPVFHQCKLQ